MRSLARTEMGSGLVADGIPKRIPIGVDAPDNDSNWFESNIPKRRLRPNGLIAAPRAARVESAHATSPRRRKAMEVRATDLRDMTRGS